MSHCVWSFSSPLFIAICLRWLSKGFTALLKYNLLTASCGAACKTKTIPLCQIMLFTRTACVCWHWLNTTTTLHVFHQRFIGVWRRDLCSKCILVAIKYTFKSMHILCAVFKRLPHFIDSTVGTLKIGKSDGSYRT